MGQDLIHYKVTGRVQGVSFRYYTQKEARKLNLRGWVRNNPDSSVEGVAVGDSQQVKAFQAFLHKGPSSAQVNGVELLRDISDASNDEIKSAIGPDSSGYEVRH